MFREMRIIIGFSIACILYGSYLLGNSVAHDISHRAASTSTTSTLALAPLSLGNPFASMGPETSLSLIPKSKKPELKNQLRLAEKTFTVRQGDTLETLLNRAGISRRKSHAAAEAFSKKFNPRLIRSGQKIRIRYTFAIKDIVSNDAKDGMFVGFRYEPKFDQEVTVLQKTNGSFEAMLITRKVTRHLTRSEGIIDSSLYAAGKKAGLPSTTLAELIRAFSWDVDFQRDIRKGDKFEALFNKAANENGKIVNSNEILFAALTLRGERKTIYRLDNAQGGFEYFDEKGHSAQKALMRTPIDGARLSSGFGRRRHPILGYTKMHRGVDFAAPKGTPIYAAGNGIVELAQRNGSYGKYIRIRHNSNYKTAYAHMSGYGRAIRKGVRVNQGQIIGYVGSTGRSTGNHLHYEIIRNGRKLNPMRLKMPSGRKLAGNKLNQFLELRVKLDSLYLSLPNDGAVQISSAN